MTEWEGWGQQEGEAAGSCQGHTPEACGRQKGVGFRQGPADEVTPPGGRVLMGPAATSSPSRVGVIGGW